MNWFLHMRISHACVATILSIIRLSWHQNMWPAGVCMCKGGNYVPWHIGLTWSVLGFGRVMMSEDSRQGIPVRRARLETEEIWTSLRLWSAPACKNIKHQWWMGPRPFRAAPERWSIMVFRMWRMCGSISRQACFVFLPHRSLLPVCLQEFLGCRWIKRAITSK